MYHDNLKKTILFIMPTNLAQGLLIVIALLAGTSFAHAGTDSVDEHGSLATLSFGLAFEAAERNIMRRPPRQTGQHVMDAYTVWRVAFVGTMIAIAAFCAGSPAGPARSQRGVHPHRAAADAGLRPVGVHD